MKQNWKVINLDAAAPGPLFASCDLQKIGFILPLCAKLTNEA
jgi:hypothetical protein